MHLRLYYFYFWLFNPVNVFSKRRGLVKSLSALYSHHSFCQKSLNTLFSITKFPNKRHSLDFIVNRKLPTVERREWGDDLEIIERQIVLLTLERADFVVQQCAYFIPNMFFPKSRSKLNYFPAPEYFKFISFQQNPFYPFSK